MGTVENGVHPISKSLVYQIGGKDIVKKWPKVSIIILNWNGWKDTIECLESLYQIAYPNYDVIVVDNGSDDESIEKIKEWAKGKMKVKSKFFEYNPMKKPIRYIEYNREAVETEEIKEIQDLPSDRKMIIIRNERNYGFAEGNNVGMRYALRALDPDYILLLNNDTVVESKFLSELVEVAEGDEKIGIVGPSIYLFSKPDKLQFEWKYKKINIPKEDYSLSGCVFLIKSSLINIVGLLDPAYFLYYEENDYFARAKKNGYKVKYVPTKNKVLHKVSASVNKVSELQIYYMTKNRFLFMKKNSTRLQFLLFFLNFFIKDFTLMTGSLLILHKDLKSLKIFWRAVYDGILLALEKEG